MLEWGRGNPSYTAGSDANWYRHWGEHYGGSLKKLNIELPYDPTTGGGHSIPGESHEERSLAGCCP